MPTLPPLAHIGEESRVDIPAFAHPSPVVEDEIPVNPPIIKNKTIEQPSATEEMKTITSENTAVNESIGVSGEDCEGCVDLVRPTVDKRFRTFVLLLY